MRRPQRVWNCTQGVIHVQRLNLLGLLGEEKAQLLWKVKLKFYIRGGVGGLQISEGLQFLSKTKFLMLENPQDCLNFFLYSRAKFGLSSPEEEWNIWLSLFVSSQHLRKVSIPFYWFYWTQCDRCRNSSTRLPKKILSFKPHILIM